jgi:heme A synthase
VIGLLVGLIVLCVVVAIVWWIIQQIPIPAQFKWIVYVVFGLVILLIVLNYLPADIPHGRWG